MKKTIAILIAVAAARAVQAQPAAAWCSATGWGPLAQAAKWSHRFCSTYKELRTGNPATASRAEKQARTLLDEILDSCVSGPDGSRALAFTAYLLAVAEEREGRADDAAWHWQMAQFLAPALRQTPDDFPDVEAFLRTHLTSAKRWELLRERERGETITVPVAPGGRDIAPDALQGSVTAPVLRRKVKVRRPSGVCGHPTSGVAVVETYIDKNGTPREPTIYQGSGHLVLDVAAMEAVGQWRFKPAMSAGQRIEVWFYPRVEFQ